MEFPTDPQLMAAVTPDSSLEPLSLLLKLEEHFEETGELISIEEYLMTAKKQTPEATPATERPEDLAMLNKRMDGCIGLLHVDSSLHSHLQEQAEQLKRMNVQNLYWIAMMLTDFGTLPTKEQVLETAPAVSSAPDSFIYNRELVPDSYAFQNQDTRTAVSGKQYASIMQNAERIQRNALTIRILKKAGYTADHVSKDDVFQELDGTQRMRQAQTKANADNAKRVQAQALKEAATQVDIGID